MPLPAARVIPAGKERMLEIAANMTGSLKVFGIGSPTPRREHRNLTGCHRVPAAARGSDAVTASGPVRPVGTAPVGGWKLSGPFHSPEWQEGSMYLARFSYDVLPVNRQRAMEFIRREVQAARGKGLNSRLLVPLTRGEGGAALQFEVELTSFDQLDQFRQSGVGSNEETSRWMHDFSQILLCPPEVTLLRLDASA